MGHCAMDLWPLSSTLGFLPTLKTGTFNICLCQLAPWEAFSTEGARETQQEKRSAQAPPAAPPLPPAEDLPSSASAPVPCLVTFLPYLGPQLRPLQPSGPQPVGLSGGAPAQPWGPWLLFIPAIPTKFKALNIKFSLLLTSKSLITPIPR